MAIAHNKTAEPAAAPEQQHGLRVLVILSALMTFASISTDLYLPALPLMGASLHADAGLIALTISGRARLRRDGVSYLFAGADGRDLGAAMDELGQAFGIRTILLEGGGVLNGVFLKAGLIDEISVLVYPGVDGLAGISSIFEYHGKAGEQPADGQRLRHTATATLEGGTVWLRYAVERT